MARRLISIAAMLGLLSLVGCTTAMIGGSGAAQAASTERPCTHRAFETVSFIVCTYRPSENELRIVDSGADGVPLRTFDALKASLGADATRVAFAMNAGMFDETGAPVGLLVQNGVTQHRINTSSGAGNFNMKPNGVFWVDKAGVAHIDTTSDFIAQAADPQWATQSGPMLVIDGKLHPNIARDGPSKFVRNGVGTSCKDGDGAALFVISNQVISFGKIARFFRDKLKCKSALYFDGNVSSLWAPSLGRKDSGALLGPMVVVLRR